jgi:hypothetical protein
VRTNEMIKVPTPEAFGSTVQSAEISLLPLVSDRSRRWAPGWVTYSDGFDNNPDMEVFCGGENEKASWAAACWRQGNLLHFGFEQDPAELNENGRRLLLNAIAYISRFAEDRPIAVTPSVFAGPVALPRTYLDRRVHGKGNRQDLEWMVSGDLFAKLQSMSLTELSSWYDANRPYLHPGSGEEPKLEINTDAQSLTAPIDQPAFFERCIAALNGATAQTARTLLARHAPTETKALKSAEEWSKWFSENKVYLFFSDQGDYRWYIDPLARKRGIPSAKLRGPARASRE